MCQGVAVERLLLGGLQRIACGVGCEGRATCGRCAWGIERERRHARGRAPNHTQAGGMCWHVSGGWRWSGCCVGDCNAPVVGWCRRQNPACVHTVLHSVDGRAKRQGQRKEEAPPRHADRRGVLVCVWAVRWRGFGACVLQWTRVGAVGARRVAENPRGSVWHPLGQG